MKKSNAGRIVSYILIVMVIVVAIGVCAHFTDGFESEFKTFYATVNGKDVMNSSGGYVLTPESPMSVDVKYTFGAFNKEETKDYSYKIVPNKNAEGNLEFVVDGETHYLSDETNLAEGFVVEKTEKSLKLMPKGGLTDILKELYPDSEISDCTGKGYPDMFTLVLTSYDGKSNVNLHFGLSISVSGVTLDKAVIEL